MCPICVAKLLYIDNEKFFDRIWQNDILYELYNLNVDTRFWQIIKKTLVICIYLTYY